MLELLYTAYLIQPLIWNRLWVRGRKAPAYENAGVNVTVFTAIR